MEGWWQPFFFVDTTGVQGLFSGLKIDGFFTFAWVSFFLLILCYCDRRLAFLSAETRKVPLPSHQVTEQVLASMTTLTAPSHRYLPRMKFEPLYIGLHKGSQEASLCL